MTDVRVTDVIAECYYDAYNHLLDEDYLEFWMKGGRSSAKSSFAAICCIIGMVSDPEANVMIFRKYQSSIRGSAWELIQWAVHKLHMSHLFNFNVSVFEVTYLPTGQKIKMGGLDDPNKWRSTALAKGRFKYMWFEEAADFNGLEEIRNVRQSMQRGSDKPFFTFFTYNPPNDPHNWINREVKVPNTDRMILHTTYLDIPKEWAGKQTIAMAEHLKKVDYEAYRHEYLGEAVGRAEQIIFHGKWEVEQFDTPALRECKEGRFFYGVDWGFANDDLAIVRCFIKDNRLYVDYAVGGTRIDIGRPMINTFDEVPDIKRWKIYADSNRPESISYMKRQGYTIEGVKKWTGIVEDSVDYLRSFEKIVIHPRCAKLIEEMKTYSYKVDKNTGEILRAVVDGNDHYIDAVRYALNTYIRKDVSILDAL